MFDHTSQRKRRSDAKYASRDEQKNASRKARRLRNERRFVGVDGEGVTENGVHSYVLLSVGSESYHDNGNPIHLDGILEFLWDQYLADPDAIYVGFYLSYDFTMWLRELPYDRAFMLLSEEGARKRVRKMGKNPVPFPVYYKEWEMDMHAGKRFKLRRKGSNSWLYICDVGPFFQTSFMSAIDPASWPVPIVNDREYALLKEGKAGRADGRFNLEMVRYNTLENDVLGRLMQTVNQGFVQMGIQLRKTQWYGPGQVAQNWLNLIGAPSKDDATDEIPYDVLLAGRASYYGGWFVISAHGHLPGETHEYDLNSAYPFAIANLPCFKHGEWYREFMHTGYTLIDATVRQTIPRRLGTMPHRTDEGTILQPRLTRGWYWRHEIAAAIRAGCIQDVNIHDAWTFIPGCKDRPFGAIAELYEMRRTVGKNTPLGKALKLTYNSAYGKLAQSIGDPRYANPIYASLITASCRTAIWDAISSHPEGADAVTMVATDGVYFTSEHPSLPISDKLGEWSHEVKRNMCQFMPGLYWDDESRKQDGKLKSRGVAAGDMRSAIESLDRKWRTKARIINENPDESTGLIEIFGVEGTRELYKLWPGADIPISFGLISAKLALHRHAWHTAGTIDTRPRVLVGNPSDKRDCETARTDALGRIWTEPYEVAPDGKVQSTPYEERFGLELRSRFLEDERLTDTGTIDDEVYAWVQAIAP